MTAARGFDRIIERDGGPVRLEGTVKTALEVSRSRLVLTAAFFTILFAVLTVRVVDLSVVRGHIEPLLAQEPAATRFVTERANIYDRNGVLIATSLPTASLFVDPRDFKAARENPALATQRLAEILPGLDIEGTKKRLIADRVFVYLRRDLTPAQQYRINRLGIAGLYFQKEEQRVYPQGRLFAHIVGLTDTDGIGTAGLEKSFGDTLRTGAALNVSLDTRYQAILRDELMRAIDEFKALGGAGVVMDVRTGELLALASFPDYDPNDPQGVDGEAGFNRASMGVYEMGSTFKLFNTAIALNSKTVKLTGGYDARKPIRVSRFLIRDDHPKKRWLSVPEILVFSSNIGSAKMALDIGSKTQQSYIRKFGLLDPAPLELPEVGRPLSPLPWREINTMTIAYGHGLAVSPVQLAAGVAAIINGGYYRPPTVLKRDPAAVPQKRVVSKKTSKVMRDLMRLVVTKGTGGKADAPGYLVGGKTGTAEKAKGKRYVRNALLSSFVAAFPMDDPRYVILISLDEPKGTKKTFGYATGGWVAAPSVRRIVERIAPLEGLAPTGKDRVFRPGHPMFIKAKKRG